MTIDDNATPVGPAQGTIRPVPAPLLPTAALHDTMRHLWMDHIVWSRVVTMSIFSDLKGIDSYESRLSQNVSDVRKLLSPFLSDDQAAEFSVLYDLHVTMASDVFDAYKSGDETLIRDTTYAWYQNADDIASYLCKLTPSWDYAEMRMLWRKHLDTVVDEALDYQQGDYAGDVMCYDAAQDHVFVLADYLTSGLLTLPSRK